MTSPVLKNIATYGGLLSIPALIAAAGFYFMANRGQAPAPATQPTQAESPVGAQHENQVASMVERLAKRLEANPENADGWLMLARSYAALGNFPGAVKAFRNALEHTPETADILADYADVLAMANGGKISGEPEALVDKALKLDPTHLKALALSGTAAYKAGRFDIAIARWEKALAAMPPGHEQRAGLESSIADARLQMAAGGRK